MLTVNLPPEVESQVRQNAAEQGYDTDTCVNSLILQALRQSVPPIIRSQTSTEDFIRHIQEMGRRCAPSAPPIPDEALRRENLYDDEGR